MKSVGYEYEIDFEERVVRFEFKHGGGRTINKIELPFCAIDSAKEKLEEKRLDKKIEDRIDRSDPAGEEEGEGR